MQNNTSKDPFRFDKVVANVKEAVELQLSGENAGDLGFSEKPEVLINLELANLELCPS